VAGTQRGDESGLKQALVVDDHPMVRRGVKDLLQKVFPSIAIKESSGDEGLADEICGRKWAFVVLDINLPKHNGIDIIKKARTCCPDIPIVVFSLFPEAQYAARALRAGAVSYLAKTREAHELVDAVKMALRGQRAKPVARAIVTHPALSDREVEVLRLFARGMSRKEIAQHLNISGKTVSTYRARIQEKLGFRNLLDLARYATEEGLLE
jgi:DNA-binding NarL/FixJ family response regulator